MQELLYKLNYYQQPQEYKNTRVMKLFLLRAIGSRGEH